MMLLALIAESSERSQKRSVLSAMSAKFITSESKRWEPGVCPDSAVRILVQRIIAGQFAESHGIAGGARVFMLGGSLSKGWTGRPGNDASYPRGTGALFHVIAFLVIDGFDIAEVGAGAEESGMDAIESMPLASIGNIRRVVPPYEHGQFRGLDEDVTSCLYLCLVLQHVAQTRDAYMDARRRPLSTPSTRPAFLYFDSPPSHSHCLY